MFPQIEQMNQNQRVDIIELLQNVIFELQTQIDKNPDQATSAARLIQGGQSQDQDQIG